MYSYRLIVLYEKYSIAKTLHITCNDVHGLPELFVYIIFSPAYSMKQMTLESFLLLIVKYFILG